MGDHSLEETNGGDFRSRANLLGDVVHSAPSFVADRDFGYTDQSYREYLVSDLVQDRMPMVYIGSNDGYLHGFTAPATTSGGTEAFAYLPRSVFPNLNDLLNPNYEHHYFVDGTAIVVDAQLDNGSTLDWRSVLVGTFGAGAEGLFALDVSDPSKFDDLANNGDDIHLWEIDNQFPTASGGVTNLTSSAAATQSSTEFGAAADRAIDGGVDGDFFDGSVTHTQNETHAWLELELDELSYIDEIEIYNRSDCCSNRLEDFSVFVSPNPMPDKGLVATRNQPGVTEIFVNEEAGIDPDPTVVEVGEVAKYVRVQLNDANALSIAELKVYGTVPSFPYLGHLLDRPSIVRVLQNEDDGSESVEWYTITGNGAHSAGDIAAFYQIGLTDGLKKGEIILDDSGDNGIISNTAIDIDGDDFVDRVYLTDIKGQIWRLDWNRDSKMFDSFYKDGDTPIPFFAATDTLTGGQHPITSAVEVTRFPGDTDALMLHIGAGKYYDIEDNIVDENEPLRSFYGILDRGDNISFTTITKSSLASQTVELSSVNGNDNGNDVRAVTGDIVDYSLMNGWFIDLPTNGERVIHEPLAIRDRILFTTIIPNPDSMTDPCTPEVTGWLMEVDAQNGTSPETVTFDANNDGNFNDDDLVTLANGSTAHVAGIQPSTGAPLPPSIIRVEPGEGQEGSIRGILSDTSGELQEFTHEAPVVRTSWIRLN